MADLNSALASILQVPGLQELLNQSITQQRQLAPLRTAVTQQAANMLPSSAFGAGGGRPDIASIAPANYTTPAPSGGSDLARTLATLGTGAGIGGLLSRLLGGGGGSGGGGNMANLVNALKKAFSRQRQMQGNKPNSGGAMNNSPQNLQDLMRFLGWDDGSGDFTGPRDRPPIPDTDTEFTGPVDDPSWYNGPDATYDPGGYNFTGPMPNGGGGDSSYNDYGDEGP